MRHILLAEDNLGDIPIMRGALKKHKIEHGLHVVRDSAGALAFLARLGQPGGTPCPEVLEEFYKHQACAKTPVIVVTSSNRPQDGTRRAKSGLDYYFKKPSDLSAFLQLGAVVREIIEKRAA